MLHIAERTIPDELLGKLISRIEHILPYKCRGIMISKQLITITVESLNDVPSKTLPQNCRNESRNKTPEGLDLIIKNKMNFDTRTANIVSDVLAEAGVVEVTHVINPKTGRSIKATKLLKDWTW